VHDHGDGHGTRRISKKKQCEKWSGAPLKNAFAVTFTFGDHRFSQEIGRLLSPSV
jgi:hypothetical protein